MMIQLPSPKDRDLYLAQQVDQVSINNITKSIVEINNSDRELEKLYTVYNLVYSPAPIKVYIDSYGGNVYQCLGLLGIIEKSQTPIHTIVTGAAMSCGFIIAIAGHKRFAYSKASFMYHQISNFSLGTIKDLQDELKQLEYLQETFENFVVEKTAISRKKLKEVFDLKKDWHIDTKKAIELEIIDEEI